jgi:hypothetical protein
MVGRPRKIYTGMVGDITMTDCNNVSVPVTQIQILCPECGSDQVGPIGDGKVQCKNRNCPFLKNHAKGKQFRLRTSAYFRNSLKDHLQRILKPLIIGETTQSAIGKQFDRSPALITYLRKKIQTIFKRNEKNKKLVLKHTLEDAVAIDEMFIKINGKTAFILMATCYKKRKVLAVKVTSSRDDLQMRALLDEAELNNGKPFQIITIDAWGGSQKMAKNLDRPIILVIHKHKAPYKKAVIWSIEYEHTESTKKRIIHKIGVKTNFFTTRHKREYHYLREEEDLTPKAPKPKGRPKGVKNGKGKKKKKPKSNNKRGPKGIFTVFDKGQRGYAKVNPSKKSVKIAKGGSNTVSAVLNQVIQVFAGMTIQNNLAENKNSVVEHHVWFSGPKDDENFETRLRTYLFYLNNPDQISKIKISHRLRSDLLDKELNKGIFGSIFMQQTRYMQIRQKMEAIN